MTNHFAYADIKAMAKDEGCRVPDLLALAPKNDPFYCGTPSDLEQGMWFADIWEDAGYTSGVHLRRVHYWTISQRDGVKMPNGEKYENTEKCWDYLVQASKCARYLGYVDIADIADKKSPTPHVNAPYNLEYVDPIFQVDIPNLDAPTVRVGGITDLKAQPYHLEVWCEKSTMDDVLDPVCRQYNANLVTFEGEVSITACYALIQRIKASWDKPTRIWYISDFDPAGNSMPVAMSRKVEYMLGKYDMDVDVRVKPLVLTAQQIKKYKLPRIPIKDSEKRAASFEAAFGAGAVELDALEALHSGTLGNILRSELRKYYNTDARDDAMNARSELASRVRKEVTAIVEKYQTQIDAVRQMGEDLKAIQVDSRPYAVTRYDPHVEETDDWLFNSSRKYLIQIAYYKAHKSGERVE